MKQKILWTALPHGFRTRGKTRTLSISVLVSPRLDPEADPPRLDTFPEWTKWPATVMRHLQFSVRFGTTEVPATVVQKPDPALWVKLFPGDTPVAPLQIPDNRQRPVRSYGVRTVLHSLRDAYRVVGENSPDDLPGLPFSQQPDPALANLIGEIGPVLADIGRRKGDPAEGNYKDYAIDRYLKENGAIHSGVDPALLGFGSRAALEFHLANRFYRRPESTPPYFEKPDVSVVPARPAKPDWDFHMTVASLGDYPELMRCLGLVLELSVKDASFPALSTVQVQPLWDGQPRPAQDQLPLTRYTLDEKRFDPRPISQEYREGMINLSDVKDGSPGKGHYDLFEIDVDGAAMKTVNFTGNMMRLAIKSDAAERGIAYTMPDRGGLPNLRSAGLALARRDRAHRLAQAFHTVVSRAGDLQNPNAQVALSMEDLVRGYRVDIQDLDAPKKPWRSLCERQGRFVLAKSGGEEIPIGPDEGYVKAGSATSADSTSDLYYHETLFRWTGWSLCAPRPGKTLVPRTEEGELTQLESPQRVPNKAETHTGLEVSFKPRPGSLPRLRFGRSYRMRVRTTDLAGNSEPPDSAEEKYATDRVTHHRFEPVDPPALVLQDAVTEGESLERMVIRSNYDKSTAEYIAGPEVAAALAGELHAYGESSLRHAAPPKTSQETAERHGMLDESMGLDPNGQPHPPAVYDKTYDISVREQGTFYDLPGAELITPPGTPQPHGSLPLAPPTPENPAGERLAPGQYLVVKGKLGLPYLPDPIASGIALIGVPGVTQDESFGDGVHSVMLPNGKLVLKVPFSGTWPDFEPIRVEIRERPGEKPDAQDACAQVFADPDSGKPRWNAAERLLTVFLTKGETARVRYSSYVQQKHLKLMGIWSWIPDSPKKAQLERRAANGAFWMLTPYRTLELVHALRQPLCEPLINKMSAQKLQVGDTAVELRVTSHLHVPSTGQLDLLAGWTEWVDDPADPGPKQVDRSAHVAEMTVDEGWANDVTLRSQLFRRPLRHEFGDTKHRSVGYSLKASTRFMECFHPKLTAKPEDIVRNGPVFPGVNVLNSARPAAPRVAYIVPFFEWQRSSTGSAVSSTRRGGGLRIYLERPWFSSGDGELLGVILAQPLVRLRLGARRAPVTEWGRDPIFLSSNLKPKPQIADFPDSVRSGSGLSVPGYSGGVAVAGHQPVFDPDRGMWYCDIRMNTARAYYPFVRFTLARYQPDSISGAHLSPIVIAHFAQPVPDRTVTVTQTADPRVLNVTVYGTRPSETSSSRAMKTDPVAIPPKIPGFPSPPIAQPDPRTGLNEVEIAVEVRDPDVDPAERVLGWVPAEGAVVKEKKPPRFSRRIARELPFRIRQADATDVEAGKTVASEESIAQAKPAGEKFLAADPVLAHPSAADREFLARPVAEGILTGILNPLWQGTVELPEELAGLGGYRILVREFEKYFEDDFGAFLAKRLTRRLVYADAIEFPPVEDSSE